MEKKSPSIEITDLYHECAATVELVFSTHTVAHEEIAAAMKRHPQYTGVLVGSIDLLQPTHPLMRNEVVYRSHCREILTRVVAGTDTRPGTAAEVCVACAVTSARAPFTTSAAGLYLRMWQLAGLAEIDGVTGDLAYYEGTVGSRIDELEAMTRRRLAVPNRRLAPAERDG